MRVAVISDVHGNLEALEAALSAIDASDTDALWCLGDLVGYGPRPNECCALVAARAAVCLVGNHDLGVLGRIDLDVFSQEAAESARWTRTVLSEQAEAFLVGLPATHETDEAMLAHGSPRDPVWEYVLALDQAVAALAASTRSLVLVGHSHAALQFADGAEPTWGLAPDGTELPLEPQPRRLLNPGSVGQPRDGDPRAAWLLLDFDERRAVFKRAEYDVEKTQAQIHAAGLPAELADRLAEGV